MDGSYGEEDLELIHSLVKNNIDASQDWLNFSIEQIGRAKTYKEGLQKLNKLKIQENVLTLELGDSASDVQRELNKAVKRQKLLLESETLKLQLSLPDVDSVSQEIEQLDKSIKEIQTDFGDNCNTNELSHPKPSGFQRTSPTVCAVEDISGLQDVINCTPVIEVDKLYYKSAVMAKLDNLYTLINEMKLKQDEMLVQIENLKTAQDATSNFLSDKKLSGKPAINFEAKHGISIPMSTYQQFEIFETKLKTDQFFKKDVYVDLKSLTDKNLVINKCIANMLRKYFAKELAVQFTAVRTSTVNKLKHKFKPTEFCNMIDALIIKLRKDKLLSTEADDLVSALTDVLSNASRWK